MPPVICITGPSGAGKTTLMSALIREFRALGLRVAALKHASHGFHMDRPGKDTWRLREAGALDVAVVGGGRVALLGDAAGFGVDGPTPDPHTLARLLPGHVDLVLAEGFSSSRAPRVEVEGADNRPAIRGAGRPLAVVVRAGRHGAWPAPERGVPVFSAEDPASLAGFLLINLGIQAPARGRIADAGEVGDDPGATAVGPA